MAACRLPAAACMCCCMPDRLPGGLPPVHPCARSRLSSNRMRGTLPPEWGQRGAWPQLQTLALVRAQRDAGGGAACSCADCARGPVPHHPPCHASLPVVRQQNNSLVGSVPAAWQERAAMPQLQEL